DPQPAAGAAPTETIEVVGIARSMPLELFAKESSGTIYVPFTQGFAGNVHFYVRSAIRGEPALVALREPVRRELQAAAPDVPFFRVHTFREHKDASLELWLLHRTSLVATAFGAAAAFIAVIGLYGAKAYGVSRRTREIGIRLALGAEPARLRSMILREGLASGLFGIALGLLLGVALGHLLGSVIVDFNGFDPAVFGLAAFALFAAALAASWLPARQATKVSPMVALRTE
ncbi:MAG TPA: FtsX-like permease family protein, partial [Opitutus sp.]|nr:FtsX-like permease family protein [Opitutus sp.]